MSPVKLDSVWVRTSAVIQPDSRLSRNELPDFSHSAIVCPTGTSSVLPMTLAVSNNAFLNASPPIPALTTEFQSISETLPAAIAWDNWYIAVDACSEDEPDIAAMLAIPLIEAVEVFRSTPAAVKVPMFF